MNLSKKLIIAGLLPIGVLTAQNSKNTSYPNVIYILADDLGIGDLGCYGQKRIKTPAIDQLSRNGLMFMQHYSGSTVSAPSRCVLMTGKHTGHSSIRGNNGYEASDGEKYDQPMLKDEVTVAQIFKQKNYATACIGKWGLGGPDTVSHPNKKGFDYFYGYLGQAHAHNYYPKFLHENDTKIMLNGKSYTHDMIISKALTFINDNSNKPFFLYLTPTIPHADLKVPDGEIGEYDGRFHETPFPGKGYRPQPKPKATFAAMVSRLDRDVQRVVDLLKEKGIFENTIIIFCSDNGTHQEGGHNPEFFDSNGSFRGYKRDLYEGGIRTPMIVSWPNQIKEPRKTFHISAFWDFLPTVCELINVSTPTNVDGISYLPTLQNIGEQKKHEYLYFEFHELGGRQAVLKDGWKLIKQQVNNLDKTHYELYNYMVDPGEIANVVKQYPEKTVELGKIMNEARTSNEIWKFKFEKL